MDEDKYTDKQVCDILSDNHFSNLLQYVLHMFGTMPRSMTEEEIIQYLKMNKNIGIAFKFMPEQVKDWCRKYSKKLDWYDMDILVDCWSNGGFEKRLNDNNVYALSEDYKHEKPEQIKDFDKIKFLRKGIKMTEQEIVNILKENKNKGIAFGFMPIEVKKWCSNNDSNLIYYNANGRWGSGDDGFVFDWNVIVALPNSYELPVAKAKKDGWVEFDIDEGGDFGYLAESERDERYKSSYYSWYSWQKFLDDSRLNERGFTAFGGWSYKENPKMWFLTPQVLKDNDLCCIKPLFPIKIRFWKEYK